MTKLCLSSSLLLVVFFLCLYFCKHFFYIKKHFVNNVSLLDNNVFIITFARRTQIFYIAYIKDYNIIIKLSEYEYSNIIVRSGQSSFTLSGRPLPTQ